jgi:type III secretion system YscQ/HrcQ family protein
VSGEPSGSAIGAGAPRLGAIASRLAGSLGRGGGGSAVAALLEPLTAPVGLDVRVGPPEVLDRPAGLTRPGVVAQLAWPRLGMRVGLGIEVPLAHALVDALLGFDRRPGEERLQVTPVEWGVLTFALARALGRLAERPGPLGEWDLLLDRAGPEPFAVEGLGRVLTVRWPIRLGATEGSARLWLPTGLAWQWLLARPIDPPELPPSALAGRLADLASDWHAEAGAITLHADDLARLRAGRVLLPDGSPLRGEPLAPDGPVNLVLRDAEGRFVLPGAFEPLSAGALVAVAPPVRREYLPASSEDAKVIPTHGPAEGPVPLGAIPATLVVELARVDLPIARLAGLKAGDVVELGREPGAPVDLTCNGRLVAKGELVQVGEELGVRVTGVYL